MGCTAPPQQKAKGKATPAKPAPAATEGAEGKDDAKKNDPKAESADTGTADPSADGGCKLFCVEGTPCGDSCVAEGEECKTEGQGTACAGSERVAPKFKKGDRALQGLIKADVPAYNKAQGDPVEGYFTLEMAFEGDEKLADKANGTLKAKFVTSEGNFECELFEDKAPLTVANFVGLARGVRPFKVLKGDDWKKEPFFDGIIFHRVIENFMLQGGDPTGRGTGGLGYFVPDEFDKSLRHNKAGILSMANRNRVNRRTQKLDLDPTTGQHIGNTGSSQFFVTVVPTPQLDDRHTVFGQCDAKLPKKMSKVETITNRAQGMDHKPKKDMTIKTIEIFRKK